MGELMDNTQNDDEEGENDSFLEINHEEPQRHQTYKEWLKEELLKQHIGLKTTLSIDGKQGSLSQNLGDQSMCSEESSDDSLLEASEVFEPPRTERSLAKPASRPSMPVCFIIRKEPSEYEKL
jgi:hypothetical protein